MTHGSGCIQLGKNMKGAFHYLGLNPDQIEIGVLMGYTFIVLQKSTLLVFTNSLIEKSFTAGIVFTELALWKITLTLFPGGNFIKLL